MVNDKEIDHIFKDVARGFGLEYVFVRVTRFKTFKIKWTRATDKDVTSLSVSHYMRLAPDWFVKESAVRVITKMLSGCNPDPTPEYSRWLDENRYIWNKLKGDDE